MGLNKKGFAITAIIYSILVIVIIIMTLVLAIISSRRQTVEKIQERVKKEVGAKTEQFKPESLISSNNGLNTNEKFGDFKLLTNADYYTITDDCNVGVNCTVKDISGSTNGFKLEYDSDNSLILKENGGLAIKNKKDFPNITDEFSINITVKGATGQHTQEGTSNYGNSILAMSGNDLNVLFWIYYLDGKLGIRAYNKNIGELIDISSYNNKKVNIQVTARKGGNVIVYINGEKTSSFISNNVDINYTSAIIGDLRPGRGLKFIGNVYEVEIYNRVLTSAEVNANYNHANKEYSLS